MIRNVISVIDGETGSCGKAKVVGEIATRKDIFVGASVTNCMPNAGHTFVDENGVKYVFRNIPVSSMNSKTELFIGPGSSIDMGVFEEEYSRVEDIIGDRKIYVHEMVPLIDEKHKQYEREHLKSGSTFKGCAAVSKDKILRDEKLNFFKGFKNAIVCSNEEYMNRLYEHLDNPNEYVILEGSQGCDLDLNHSGNYPYVTSRNISTTQLLADSGISAERLLETIMVIRPFPIRISNTNETGRTIYTGGYGKGLPLTWTQINISSMVGSYPFETDVECYDNSLNPGYIKHLMSHVPTDALIQIFGDNYKSKGYLKVKLLDALELERLYYKNKGIREYESGIINIYDGDYKRSIIDLSEETTVTKRERRVFDLDIQKLNNNVRINNPYALYLNFFQHLDIDFIGCKKPFNEYYFSKYIREYLNWLESETNTDICALGTGPKNNEYILKKDLIKRI